MEYWGYHLTLDCSQCDPISIRDYDTIYKFTKQLVKDIDMIAYGEPQIIKFGPDDKVGYTLIQLIETSNICCHFVDPDNTMYLDVFSCKEYDPEIVKKLVDMYFRPKTMKENFFTRQA